MFKKIVVSKDAQCSEINFLFRDFFCAIFLVFEIRSILYTAVVNSELEIFANLIQKL